MTTTATDTKWVVVAENYWTHNVTVQTEPFDTKAEADEALKGFNRLDGNNRKYFYETRKAA